MNTMTRPIEKGESYACGAVSDARVVVAVDGVCPSQPAACRNRSIAGGFVYYKKLLPRYEILDRSTLHTMQHAPPIDGHVAGCARGAVGGLQSRPAQPRDSAAFPLQNRRRALCGSPGAGPRRRRSDCAHRRDAAEVERLVSPWSAGE